MCSQRHPNLKEIGTYLSNKIMYKYLSQKIKREMRATNNKQNNEQQNE